jgi:uncharacterized protein YwqG
MSLLRAIFGKFRSEPRGDKSIEEYLDYLNSLRISAIALSKSDSEAFSRIGGLPALPENLAWPEWRGLPLAFLCQLDLSEMPEECVRNGLPSSGILYFFYHQEQQTWGFDPKDKGSWQVVYTDEPREQCVERSAPKGLRKEYVYGEKAVLFIPVETYPDWQDDRIGSLNLTNKQSDEYIDLCSAVFQGGPAHHLFGYPSPVQGNDMDLESQLVSHGLYCGDASGYNDPRAKQLEAGRSDWILLLQLDTDDDVSMMWGDGGMLYFWINKTDLEAAHFEDCWMILQCS